LPRKHTNSQGINYDTERYKKKKIQNMLREARKNNKEIKKSRKNKK
jgi:hypothetical protein